MASLGALGAGGGDGDEAESVAVGIGVIGQERGEGDEGERMGALGERDGYPDQHWRDMPDMLPPEAALEARVMELALSRLAAHGYQRVKPPLVEFEESLLGGPGAALASQTLASFIDLRPVAPPPVEASATSCPLALAG